MAVSGCAVFWWVAVRDPKVKLGVPSASGLSYDLSNVFVSQRIIKIFSFTCLLLRRTSAMPPKAPFCKQANKDIDKVLQMESMRSALLQYFLFGFLTEEINLKLP
ncbi:hypothetical protein AB6A40_007907 [Gnathostoma spinigerum]|uniref:Uncharacterized protein n=1 Tax=Gnathostoma spinigerum TaxID=75299 RepID=A0ABD6EMV4_9BILA